MAAVTPCAERTTVTVSMSCVVRELMCTAESSEVTSTLGCLLQQRTLLSAKAMLEQCVEVVGREAVERAALVASRQSWIEYKDDATGQPYYYNVALGESTWENPRLGRAPPPPPPPPRPAAPPEPQRTPLATTPSSSKDDTIELRVSLTEVCMSAMI